MQQPSAIDIIYQDNHLLAVNKPSGLLTQPSGTLSDSLEARAKIWIKESKGKPGNVFLHAVHRLDKVVSGIVLFALTEKALKRMNVEMKARRITKIYHAIINHEPPDEKGTLKHYLRHSRLKSCLASPDDAGAKLAVMDYQVLKRKKDLMLLELRIETGRYHQIRAQLAACGCPIFGDVLYGNTVHYEKDCIALHHRRMEFIHPTQKIPITIEADYPNSWPM